MRLTNVQPHSQAPLSCIFCFAQCKHVPACVVGPLSQSQKSRHGPNPKPHAGQPNSLLVLGIGVGSLFQQQLNDGLLLQRGRADGSVLQGGEQFHFTDTCS